MNDRLSGKKKDHQGSCRSPRKPASVISNPMRMEILEDRCVPAYAPVGAEFLVNTFTAGNQEFVNLAMDDSGNFVATWTSNGQLNGVDVYAQRYNASGVAQGSAFLVNQYTTGDQLAPNIAMDANGNFVVTWTTKASVDGSGDSVWARRYDANGNALSNEFRVNTYTQYNQNDSSIAMDSNGNFTIAWSSGTDDYFASPDPQDGVLYGVYAQRYNSAGATIGGEFRVNSSTNSAEGLSAVAMDDNGNMVIAFSRIDDITGSQNPNIYARRYFNGVAQGNNFVVNAITAETQFLPTVAMDNSGNFVVAWSSNHETGTTTNVFARRFDSLGVGQGSEFRVNTYTTNEQLLASVAMDDSGNFVVAWQSGDDTTPPYQDGSQYGVYAQRYTSGGNVDGGEFQVSTYTAGHQYFANAAMRKTNGDLVVGWTSAGQDGSGYGIYAQRFKLNNAPTAHPGGPYNVTEGSSIQFDASLSSDPDGHSLTYAWDINGDYVFTDATGVTPTLTWAQLNALGIVDGPDYRSVGVRVTDQYGLTATAWGAAFNIINGNPTATISTSATAIVRGEPTSFTLTASDPSPVDQAANFTFYIDWNGDFGFEEVIVAPSGTVVSHVFPTSGNVNINVAALDKDFGYFPLYTLPKTIVNYALKPNPGNPSLNDLVWGATTAQDSLIFYATGGNVGVGDLISQGAPTIITGVTGDVVIYGQAGNDLFLTLNLNGATVNGGDGDDGVAIVSATGGNYELSGDAGIDALYVLNGNGSDITMDGGAGDDELYVVNGTSLDVTMLGGADADAVLVLAGTSLTLNMDGQTGDDTMVIFDGTLTSAVVNGGDDNDVIINATASPITINGGNGDDLVHGGFANDSLSGNAGNDVLLDFDGADSFAGGAGEDLIIAGVLTEDYYGDNDFPGFVQVWAQWIEPDPMATRMDYLDGTLTGGIIESQFVLDPGTTVLDDGQVDSVLGEGDADWLWYDFAEDTSDYPTGADVRVDIG